MPYDKDGKYFRKPVSKENSALNKEKLLSERKRGYLIAILFGTFGIPLGWITSPLVLYVLNKKLKEKNGKVPNRFLIWALIWIIGAPLSIAPVYLLLNETSRTVTEKVKTFDQGRADVFCGIKIKDTLNDPRSYKFDRSRVVINTEDPELGRSSIVYRAKNGFGAYLRQVTNCEVYRVNNEIKYKLVD